MIARMAGTLAGLLMLGACSQLAQEPPVSDEASVRARDAQYNTISPSYDRTFERSFTETPFANGALSVTGADGLGDLATYRLVPCYGGQAICAGSEQGPAGQVRQTPDWFVVTGLYGQTFWLSYGGDGYLERNGQYTPLSWNARPNGTGDGDAPALETPHPHGYAVLGRVSGPLTAPSGPGLGGGSLSGY
jgi:hypothetical protein